MFPLATCFFFFTIFSSLSIMITFYYTNPTCRLLFLNVSSSTFKCEHIMDALTFKTVSQLATLHLLIGNSPLLPHDLIGKSRVGRCNIIIFYFTNEHSLFIECCHTGTDTYLHYMPILISASLFTLYSCGHFLIIPRRYKLVVLTVQD